MPTRRSLLGAVALFGAGGAAAWFLKDRIFWPEASLSPGQTDSGVLTLLETPARLPVVMVALNGRTTPALIDTGAEVTSVDQTLADEIGLETAAAPPLVAFGAGGHRQVVTGADLALEIGEIEFSRVRAAVVELGPLSQPEAGGIRLVIGQDVLGSLLIELDFEGRTARFHDRSRAAPPADAVFVPAKTRGRGLEARVRVEETVLDLLVDTGSTAAVSLAEATARTAGLLDGRETGVSRRIVLGGVSTGQVVEARGVTVAGRDLGATEVHIYPDAGVPGFPRGLLGLGAIGQGRVWLDLAGGRLALKQNGAH
jgi:predicted aspartyl protease